MKINPVCQKCFIVNIIFDFDELPMNCLNCGNPLEGLDESNS